MHFSMYRMWVASISRVDIGLWVWLAKCGTIVIKFHNIHVKLSPCVNTKYLDIAQIGLREELLEEEFHVAVFGIVHTASCIDEKSRVGQARRLRRRRWRGSRYTRGWKVCVEENSPAVGSAILL